MNLDNFRERAIKDLLDIGLDRQQAEKIFDATLENWAKEGTLSENVQAELIKIIEKYTKSNETQ